MRPALLILGFAAPGIAPQDPSPATNVVEGQVLDVLGDPVPAAEVWITDQCRPPRQLGRTKTDATGRFFMPRPEAEHLLVHATAAGYWQGLSAYPGRKDRPWTECTLFLWDAGTVTGTVTDEQGQPVAGARVRCGVLHYDPVTTDAAGRFVLDKVPLGAGRIEVVHETGTGSAEVFLRERDDVSVRLVAAGPAIRVRVLGLPAEAMDNCQLRCTVPALARTEKLDGGLTARLDVLPPCELLRPKPGRDTFVLLGLGKHEVRLEASCPGFELEPKQVVVPAHGALPVEIRARPVPSVEPDAWLIVRGVLRDDQDRPLAGQRLVCWSQTANGELTTRADGSFETSMPVVAGAKLGFRLVESEWLLHPSMGDDNAATEHVGGTHFARLKPGEPYSLRAVRGAVVRGKVLAPDGSTIGGALVQLEHEAEIEGLAGVATPPWLSLAHGRTDGQGRFALAGIHVCGCGGALRITVRDRKGNSRSESFLPRAGDEIDLGAMRLEPGASVTGLVRDAEGRPVPAAQVTLRRPDGAGWQPAAGGASNREGRYRVGDLEAGEYVLEVRCSLPQAKPVTRSLRLLPGEKRVVDVDLAR